MTVKKSVKTSIVILAVAAILGIYYIFQYTDALLVIRNIGYTPPVEVEALESGFTNHAITLFHSARPQLEESVAFNEHCSSHNANISVLGCYAGGNIYIYNIQSEELPGIRESTAAHEMLHVAWSHLSDLERMNLEPMLKEVYEAHSEISARLEVYDTENQIDEIHSRIGTEISDLPEALESYYARYFKNQDEIAAKYESYAAPFRRLAAEIEELSAQIDQENTELTAAADKYYADVSELSTRFDGFNNCARTAGCFSSMSEYNKRRDTLLTAQAELEQTYNELNSRIKAYNKLVEEYNKNILKSKNLENTINSNSPPSVNILNNAS